MGHIGDIELVYTPDKGQLPQGPAGGDEAAYAQAAEKHLSTVVQASIGRDEAVNTARVEALKMFGYTDEEMLSLGIFGWGMSALPLLIEVTFIMLWTSHYLERPKMKQG